MSGFIPTVTITVAEYDKLRRDAAPVQTRRRDAVAFLVDAYNDNDPIRLTAAVLEEVEAGDKVSKLARAFSGNKDWHKFIKEEAGQCWIEF